MADTEEGKSVAQRKRYFLEIDLYEKIFQPWEKRGKSITDRYRDERQDKTNEESMRMARYNILWSNIQTILPNVFARVPKPEVSRTYKDKDDVGRVASMILERALDFEVTHYPDYKSAVENCVIDRLLPGRGTAFVRYDPITKPLQITEDVEEPKEQIDYECSPVDYVGWKDFGHNVSRTWEEVYLQWRRVPLTKEEITKRFGKEVAKKIKTDMKSGYDDDQKTPTPQDESLMKGIIYEVWDKRKKVVVWLSRSYEKLIEIKPDPLGLDGFWPAPKPLYATLTTDSLIPVPDYALYQDLARELDTITNRINGLVEALKVVGVYDATQETLERMLEEGVANQLIPVHNWIPFGEKGGIKGTVDWMPLDMVVNALQASYKARVEAKQAVYEIMGVADILRGSSDPNETLGAQQIKGQFAGKRLKYMQNKVAEFATELLCIKAQIICNHYQPETIVMISGADQLSEQDKVLIPQAIKLLKNDVLSDFRIEVSSDSLIEIDEQQEKTDRMEFLTGVGSFLEKALQAPPQMAPLLCELLLYGVRAFKTGKQVEGLIDEQLEQFKEQAKQPQPEQPNPEMEKVKIQAQADEQQGVRDAAHNQQQLAANQQNLSTKAANEMELSKLKEQNVLSLAQDKMASDERVAMNKDQLNASVATSKAEIDRDARIGAAEKESAEGIGLQIAQQNAESSEVIGTMVGAPIVSAIEELLTTALAQIREAQTCDKTVTNEKTGNVYHIRSGGNNGTSL